MGRGRTEKLKNDSMMEKEREKRRRENQKSGEDEGKSERAREIPQSWYHMAGPPFLMRQRSVYSLALSHTQEEPQSCPS